ncbi:cation:dicarboxylase symporter family transporter [Glaciimonas sp. CA11.2]|uniref:cation:dicarboxylate symporter family transporter n=1 Tax=Glaciimonas sp. CA11.2 TaxID=3048601 RepID=UPI002AB45CCC|nr:cation:dicarboxylase symporter family transporter [Glaciimonas sp. CA11.2]MDY7546728.1 cation:dicarboxylase symporter family transporter [Glaciimonas sp. CA11.2]MEB0164737.1 cation:dicarboxylase symporter family transporter [Glaciimonas sp. CA11.2]
MATKKPLYYTLSFQLAIGLLLGAAVGLIYPSFGADLNPLAVGFVKLIKMVAGLLVFLTIVTGFAQIKKGSGLGRLGLSSLLYFEIVSTIALILGMVLANIFQPGVGLTIPVDGMVTAAKFAESGKALSSVDFILNIIPKTVVDALAGGVMLQILLVSLLFGYALYAMGERASPVTQLLHICSEAVFKVIDVVLKLAPIGVFGAVAYTLGKFGLASLMPLAKLVGLVYLGCGLFFLIVFGTVAKLANFSLLKFLRYIKEEMIIAFTTASSEAALPGLMKKLESAGCSKGVIGFVVPAGYSFNLDGSSIYMTLAAMFIAQAAGLHLGIGEQVSLLFVFPLTSKGVAGVTGGSFVTLAASLTMFPDIPLAGLALILGVDRLMDPIRTMTNTTGNGVATMAIAYWHGQRSEYNLEGETDALTLLEIAHEKY